ncbi:unnamed protein product [Aphanomyces euteiches]
MELNKLFSVDGLTVLITGGSKGIGKMMAEGIVRNGAKVYISARDKAICDETAKELNVIGRGRCIAIPEDLSTTAGCKRLVAALQQRESKLDVLINNPATGWIGGIQAHDEEIWTRVMHLNLASPFLLRSPNRCMSYMLKSAVSIPWKIHQCEPYKRTSIEMESSHDDNEMSDSPQFTSSEVQTLRIVAANIGDFSNQFVKLREYQEVQTKAFESAMKQQSERHDQAMESLKVFYDQIQRNQKDIGHIAEHLGNLTKHNNSKANS